MGRDSRHRRRQRDSHDSGRSNSSERRRRRRNRSRSRDDYRRPRRDFRRDRSPESRTYRFDSPPKDQDNVVNALAAAKAIGGGLADAQNIMQSIQTMSMAQASKVDRKLYVGNLPQGITPKELVDLVNHALIKVGGNINPGDPVISSWISSDGHYAFIEFRSPEEANNGFALNHISIHGNTLKVGRPNTYNGVFSSFKMLAGSNLMMTDGMLNPEKHAQNVLDAEDYVFDPLKESKMITEAGEAHVIEEKKIEPEVIDNSAPIITKMGVLNATSGGRMNPIIGGTINSEIYQIELPSRIIILKNIVRYEHVAYEEDYENLLSDLKKELVKYGMIVNIKIPHYPFLERKQNSDSPNHNSNSEEHKILENNEIDIEVIKSALPKKVGFGNAYVEFISVAEAENARIELTGRRYDDRFVEIWFHNEQKYDRDDFSPPIVITTGKENMFGFEGMEHLAIEFKDGQQSTVQEEIRNIRKTHREELQGRLMIKDQSSGNQWMHQAQVYRKNPLDERDPVINEE